MGPRTKRGIMQFQQQRGLAANGEIDNETLAALDISNNTSSR